MIDRPESNSRPGWLNKIMLAKAAALGSLTADELAEAEAARAEQKARVEARRLASIARARTIFSMFADGRSDVEIGKAICRTSRSVRRFAELRGYTITRSKTSVSPLVPIARRLLRNPELARQALAAAFGAKVGKTAA